MHWNKRVTGGRACHHDSPWVACLLKKLLCQFDSCVRDRSDTTDREFCHGQDVSGETAVVRTRQNTRKFYIENFVIGLKGLTTPLIEDIIEDSSLSGTPAVAKMSPQVVKAVSKEEE